MECSEKINILKHTILIIIKGTLTNVLGDGRNIEVSWLVI